MNHVFINCCLTFLQYVPGDEVEVVVTARQRCVAIFQGEQLLQEGLELFAGFAVTYRRAIEFATFDFIVSTLLLALTGMGI